MKTFLHPPAIMFLALVCLISPIQSQDDNFLEISRDPSFFPVLAWDHYEGWNDPNNQKPPGLEALKDCHFNIAGFVHTRDIIAGKDLGIKVIAYGDEDTVSFGQWQDNFMHPGLSDKEMEDKIKRIVERVGKHESVIGYYLCDEPGAAVFPHLGKAVKFVKKYAPGKIAYINLFPDYASTGPPGESQLETETYQDYIERYVDEVNPQFIGYDNYMITHTGDRSLEPEAASYYRNMLAIRKLALKHDIPFWNIVSSNQLESQKAIPSPANLSLQAYSTLAAGGKSVSWYTYYPRKYGYAPIDQDGNKTLPWYWLQEVNRQMSVLGPVMNRLVSTGVYFTIPAPAEDLPELPGKLVTAVKAETPMMVGEFRGEEGKDYVMVVNLSLQQTAKVNIILQNENYEIRRISPVDGAEKTFDIEEGYWLVAGQGILLRL